MRQSYRSNLTDEQWEVIKTLIPPAKNGGRLMIFPFCRNKGMLAPIKFPISMITM